MDIVLEDVQVSGESSYVSTEVIVNELIKNQLELHKKFDSLVWKDKESFHNAEHIRAVTEAATTYLDKSSRESDPLGVWRDLDAWNQQDPDIYVSDDEFRQIALFAIGLHDTGNFSNLDESNIQIFLDKYTAAGAEERSKLILINVINNQSLDPKVKEKYIKLASDLIDQTKFAEKLQFFGKFMKVVDQIGNDLFSKNEKRVTGLLNEMISENPNVMVNPYFFSNFVREILPKYLTSEEISLLLVLWDKRLPEEVQKQNSKILAVDFLSMV